MRSLKTFCVYVLLVAGGVISIYPLVYMLLTALKPMTLLFEFPPRFLPSEMTWSNFREAWGSQNFALYLLNSVGVTLASFALIFLLSSMLAFAYSRFDFKGKGLSFAIIMGGLVIPSLTLLIPQFVLIRQLGLFDSRWGLIVVYAAGAIPFTTFLLKGFFDSISRDIDESVEMEGGGAWTLFASIILPLSKPAFVPATIFNALTVWEEFPWALTIINDPLKRTLPIALANFQGQYTTQWGIVFAGSLIAVLPIILLFLLLQRYFIAGITAGAVKG
ncbi:Trehalose transport system permease protein SugB [compost metagenome]|jgi:ABC-type glycerol-3-phosphate transport system permease component|uniref:Carbohydrate ABC transporter permease n=1 Tax=Paenibacillus rhizolycopersici TaxID=2780073 RepID=A0ABS2H1Q8_9BACL|nr:MULTISPECIES: carbohydrate ABC transporter permease [Paenibacillus]MBM6994636.1 carbohydrate ABC transporter permease [Paenibacillus rhizolycopersici]MUG87811.1 ABC transporter permease subunit [Paenibacillus timonensis]GIP50725.1 sugar ABC transporter permease [Paenibacillus sp. J53TS2]